MHTVRAMERIEIVIRPPSGAPEGLLRVEDAMEQVLDVMRLYEEAQRAFAMPEEAFEWRLEQASANSPLTITALAEPLNPLADVSAPARRVKSEVAKGVRGLMERGEPESWMGPEMVKLAKNVFARGQNGIGSTEVRSSPTEILIIDRFAASAGMRAIEAIDVVNLEIESRPGVALGEVEGLMVAAGSWYGRPSITIRNELYLKVICVLAHGVMERFGKEHTMKELWDGKQLAVEGRLFYGPTGKLTRIEATDIREMPPVPRLHLDALLDPDLTGGLDPVEYLRRLHEGELA